VWDREFPYEFMEKRDTPSRFSRLLPFSFDVCGAPQYPEGPFPRLAVTMQLNLTTKTQRHEGNLNPSVPENWDHQKVNHNLKAQSPWFALGGFVSWWLNCMDTAKQ